MASQPRSQTKLVSHRAITTPQLTQTLLSATQTSLKEPLQTQGRPHPTQHTHRPSPKAPTHHDKYTPRPNCVCKCFAGVLKLCSSVLRSTPHTSPPRSPCRSEQPTIWTLPTILQTAPGEASKPTIALSVAKKSPARNSSCSSRQMVVSCTSGARYLYHIGLLGGF